MPFIPHTERDVKQMLDTIGAESIEQLFEEIPQTLRISALKDIPQGKNECALTQKLKQRAERDKTALCFIGAGAYQHYIPAAVWDIATRGEFMTAYTPYQAEASQGSLQVIYEFQTMVASLMGMEVANASLYDGATALAEAILMAVRCHRKSRCVLIPETIHPTYLKVVKTLVEPQNITLACLSLDRQKGHADLGTLTQHEQIVYAAVVIPQPNFFGVLEPVEILTDWAHQHNALVIGVVNPMAMALLKEPGQWGEKGVDIICGEGQPLGIPLAGGGPYFGFLACNKILVRQMPGRIVARTTDSDGQQGFTLTLQAREQHIRRSKATSNICTNQGLAVTAATVYMSLMGAEGLRQVALASYHNTQKLLQLLLNIAGVKRVFSERVFHEVLVQLPQSVERVQEQLAAQGIQAGFAVHTVFPQFKNCLLLCATETKTDHDLEKFSNALKMILEEK
jgi:glycine dehydrogenase subunit 1